MTCRELVGLVTEYLEGALPARDRQRFEAHVEICPHCLDYLGQIQVTVAMVGRLDEVAISSEAREALLGAFRDWKEPS